MSNALAQTETALLTLISLLVINEERRGIGPVPDTGRIHLVDHTI